MYYDFNGNEILKPYDFNGNIISSSHYIEGASYAFSDMQYTGSTSILSNSSEHLKRATSGFKLKPTLHANANTSTNDYEWINFSCNIAKKANENIGVWFWISANSKGVYGGKTSNPKSLSYVRIKINSKIYTWQVGDLQVGWNYLLCEDSQTAITTISVSCAQNYTSTNTNGELYIDSIEVGFRSRIAHIMFNLDCVPSNFWNVGYPLFEKYNLKCTLQYPISSTNANVGADSDYLDIAKHNELKAKGYDFAVYSGWQRIENYGDSTPFYDDESKRSMFEAHAERLWNVNRNSNIEHPSGIHSTGFLFGDVYHDACKQYGFKMIRAGNSTNGLFAYYDTEERTMVPYFIQNVFDSNSSVINNVKNAIDKAIRTGQNLQIGFHQIMSADYDTTQSGANIYVGVNGIEPILAYVKEKVNANQIVCCTISKFWDEVKEGD